jgi:hypothetical protein
MLGVQTEMEGLYGEIMTTREKQGGEKRKKRKEEEKERER